MIGRVALALGLVAACRDGGGRPAGPPVTVRFVHELKNARVRSDLKAQPQLTLRYVAVDGEYDKGADAGATTFTFTADGGAPAQVPHEIQLAPGTYRLEACLEAPGGDGCKTRPADYLASPDTSGNTRFVVPPLGGTIVVHWGALNPSLPDAAVPPDAKSAVKGSSSPSPGSGPKPPAKRTKR